MVTTTQNGHKPRLQGLPEGGTDRTAILNEFREAMRDPGFRDYVENVTSLRSDFLRTLFDPRRNLDDECGYPQSQTGTGFGSLNPELYRSLYEREPVATRVVQLMPKECWQVQPSVYEDEDTTRKTPFEEAWDDLGRNLGGGNSWFQDEEGSKIWDILKRADILAGIGHFGILLIGIDDGLPLDQPVDGVAQIMPPTNNHKLVVNSDPGQEQAILYNGVGQAVFAYEIPTTENRTRVTYDIDPKWGLPLIEKKQDYVDRPLPTRNVQSLVANATPLIQGDSARQPDQGWGIGDNQPSGPAWRPDGQIFDSAAKGTDAQYVGVQLGPPSYPADEPSKQKRKLIYLRPFDESLVQIVQYEANLSNPRFGQPVMYRITLNDPREQHSGIGLPLATVRVHWSRVIHITDQCGSMDIFHPPRLRAVLNAVLDVRKVRGAAAEGYYKSCFTGLTFSTHPQLGGDVLVDVPAVRRSVEDYQNSLQRFLIGMGGQWSTLAPSVVDPTPHVNVQVEAICIQLGCPVRVFRGSERGELASSQDDSSWNDRVRERQNNTVTPKIIIPFVDRLIQMGVLPEPTIGKQAASDPNAPIEGDKDMDGEGAPLEEGAKPEQETEDIDDSKMPDGSEAQKNAPANPRPVVGNSQWRVRLVRNADTGEMEPIIEEKEPEEVETDETGKPTQQFKPQGQGTVIKAKAGYSILWPDLDSQTEAEKATTFSTMVQGLAAYQQGLAAVICEKDMWVHLAGMDEELADSIIANAKESKAQLQQEQMDQASQLADEHGFKPAPPPGFMDPEQQKMDHKVALEAAGNPAGPPGHGGQVGGTSSTSHTHLPGVKGLPQPAAPPGGPPGAGGMGKAPFPPKPGVTPVPPNSPTLPPPRPKP